MLSVVAEVALLSASGVASAASPLESSPPSVSTQLAGSADAVSVSLAASSATSVSDIRVTDTVGVVVSSNEATSVSPVISDVPRSHTTSPSRTETSAIEVLPSPAASSDVELPVMSSNCSPAAIASSSNVVSSLSSVCAYIETPTKAVDATTRADKSESTVNLAFRSLNNFTQPECQQKEFNELFNFLNKISSSPS